MDTDWLRPFRWPTGISLGCLAVYTALLVVSGLLPSDGFAAYWLDLIGLRVAQGGAVLAIVTLLVIPWFFPRKLQGSLGGRIALVVVGAYAWLSLMLFCVVGLMGTLGLTKPFIRVPAESIRAFAPYSLTSPDGRHALSVRRADGAYQAMSFDVLDSQTGERLFSCPDAWRIDARARLDWLCSGVVMVRGSYSTSRYAEGPDGFAQISGMPEIAGEKLLELEDGLTVYDDHGWRIARYSDDAAWREHVLSFDPEGKRRADNAQRSHAEWDRATLAELIAFIEQADDHALERNDLAADNAPEFDPRYLTSDGYWVRFEVERRGERRRVTRIVEASRIYALFSGEEPSGRLGSSAH